MLTYKHVNTLTLKYHYNICYPVADPSRRLTPKGAAGNALLTTPPIPPSNPHGKYS